MKLDLSKTFGPIHIVSSGGMKSGTQLPSNATPKEERVLSLLEEHDGHAGKAFRAVNPIRRDLKTYVENNLLGWSFTAMVAAEKKEKKTLF